MAEFMGGTAHPQPAEPGVFHYRRQVAPMLWAFAALALAEIGVVHLLMWHWSRTAAGVLDGLGAALFLAMLVLILSLGRRPVLLGDRVLRIRTGLLVDAAIPLGEVAFAQSGYAPADYMPGSLLKASLLAQPNVLLLLKRDIDLPGPLGRLRRVHAVALALDEPARFLLALNTRVKNAGAEASAVA
ncbi:MAG: hypothetical protein JO013_15720 [Alphaproteobacteria bacterium]|nr:hypothetical protein [Alphaproteobacteria bacterium]